MDPSRLSVAVTDEELLANIEKALTSAGVTVVTPENAARVMVVDEMFAWDRKTVLALKLAEQSQDALACEPRLREPENRPYYQAQQRGARGKKRRW